MKYERRWNSEPVGNPPDRDDDVKGLRLSEFTNDLDELLRLTIEARDERDDYKLIFSDISTALYKWQHLVWGEMQGADVDYLEMERALEYLITLIEEGASWKGLENIYYKSEEIK